MRTLKRGVIELPLLAAISFMVAKSSAGYHSHDCTKLSVQCRQLPPEATDGQEVQAIGLKPATNDLSVTKEQAQEVVTFIRDGYALLAGPITEPGHYIRTTGHSWFNVKSHIDLSAKVKLHGPDGKVVSTESVHYTGLSQRDDAELVRACLAAHQCVVADGADATEELQEFLNQAIDSAFTSVDIQASSWLHEEGHSKCYESEARVNAVLQKKMGIAHMGLATWAQSHVCTEAAQ